jgi:hypothetical protein
MRAHATTLPSACQSRDEVRAPFADLRRRCADPFDVRGSKVSKKDHDMTRTELTTRLNALLRIGSPASGNVHQRSARRQIRDAVRLIIEDINEDGVLDVQQPPALIDVRAIKARGHVTLEELQSMTVQDIATFSKR